MADESGTPLRDLYRFRGTLTLTAKETAARAGVDYERARRIWRALGLPEVEDDVVNFDEADVRALQQVTRMVELGLDAEELIRAARTYGKAMSSVADAEARLFARNFVEPVVAQERDRQQIEERLEPVVDWLLDASAFLLDHVHRRHLTLAVTGLTLVSGDRHTENLAVGFVDLVGFSALAEDLAGEELGDVIDTFEEIAITTAAEAGVRVVKVIGDAVMLVARDPRRLVRSAASIVAAVGSHVRLPEARAGVDIGELMPLSGDYFGRAVNVAARATAFARAGTVVVSQELLDVLDLRNRGASEIGTRKLKGVGRVALFKLNPDEWTEFSATESA